MVAEGVVLFRVQHFQQGRRRVAPEVRAELVHFVQHHNRVAGASLLEALNDAARHGADIGAPVPAYFSLVVHAAQ